MRVHEFAKQKGMTSRELVDLLAKGGFSTLTHMSVMPDEAQSYVNKAIALPKPKPEPKSEPKLEPKLGPNSVQVKEVKPAITPVQEPSKYQHKKVEEKKIIEIEVVDQMPLFEVAEKMEKQSGELILALMKQGLMCNRNYPLSKETIISLAKQFNINYREPKKVVRESVVVEKNSTTGEPRAPIVVVMGHVDHGKTTLLDYIRKTNIASREKGGITQHIGAYEVDSTHGKITFLDTPGHAAFSHMRRRGASVTDIAILVVAADDGIMPQTIEAIEAAKSAKVPILVAINKIDKIESPAALERIKRQLAQHDLLPEEWGGTIICVPISAKNGKGVDDLLEMITLQAQMMDLRAKQDIPAKGYVLESNIEKGHGPVATVICTEGSLKVGDYFVSGTVSGKVRLLLSSTGQKLAVALPSMPVKIAGFDDLPSTGEILEVVPFDIYLRRKSSKEDKSISVSAARSAVEESDEVLNIIVKTDTYGSNEAVLGSVSQLAKVNKEKIKPFKIIHSAVGDISERDVKLADDTDSIIIGLHVKTERNALIFAKDSDVEIYHFDIIYRLIEELEKILEKRAAPKIVSKKSGDARVLKVFDIKGYGIVAGCIVTNGIFSRAGKVQCVRAGKIIGEGAITSLERNRKPVKEAHKDMEFAFLSSGFSEWKEGDTVNCIVETTA